MPRPEEEPESGSQHRGQRRGGTSVAACLPVGWAPGTPERPWSVGCKPGHSLVTAAVSGAWPPAGSCTHPANPWPRGTRLWASLCLLLLVVGLGFRRELARARDGLFRLSALQVAALLWASRSRGPRRTWSIYPPMLPGGLSGCLLAPCWALGTWRWPGCPWSSSGAGETIVQETATASF